MPSKFGNEFQINTYTNNSQANPSIAALTNGDFVVVWQSDGQDGSDYGIYGQRFTATGGFVGNEFRINNYTANVQRNPSLAGLSNGNFVAAWESYGQDGSGYGIYGQIVNASGNLAGSEFRINNYTTNDQGTPSLVALSNGNFVAAWGSDGGQDGSGAGVYAQILNATGGLMGNEFRINNYTPNVQGDPSLAALSNGNVVAAWHSPDGSGSGINGQILTAGGGFVGSEFRINTNTTNDQYFPSLAALSNGNFVAAWMSWGQDGGSDYGIYGQILNATGGFVGNEFRINTYTPNLQWYPYLSALSNGNFVAAWASWGQDGSGSGVYGQILTVSGGFVGSEFRINTNTINDQYNYLGGPSFAALSNGNFVTVWQSDGQDGSSYGIYGQIFYGQLVAANYGNRTFDYNASLPAKITYLSILGALNEEAISATLTLSDPTAGNLTTSTSGNVTAIYNSTNGVWQAFGPLTNINQLFSNITFLPAPNYHESLTLAVNITDGVSPPAIGSFGLAPLSIGKPTKLSSEFQVNNYTLNDQHYALSTALPDGNFVVTWESDTQDGSYWGIYGQVISPTGVKVGGEFLINTYTILSQQEPSVSALPNDNFVVVWHSNAISDYDVYGQLFQADSLKLGSEFRVNTYTTNNQVSPIVTGLTNNNFVVTWRGQNSFNNIYGQMFNSTCSKIGNEFQVNTYTTNCYSPDVKALKNGGFIVAWGADDSIDSSNVYGRIFDPSGLPLANEFRINVYTNNQQVWPAVCSLKNNHFVVSWQSYDQDSSGWGIYARLFNVEGLPVSGEVPVNTYTLNDQLNPFVMTLVNGNFVIAWHGEGKNSVMGIFARVFNSDGFKISNEFLVDTYSNNMFEPLGFPTISALADGNFALTWANRGQDGSGLGVYGQIFYGQLIAANYANRTLPYIEETPSSISHLSILGALNDETVSTTLTLSDPKAGSLKTATSGNATSTYNPTTGRWQALGYLNDINQLLSTLIFLPAPNYKQNVTLTVNMTDGFSAPVVGSLTLTPIPIGQPTRLGSEFQVHTNTTNNQGLSSTAALNNGNFVAIWNSNLQDGSGYGVYGQLFDPSGIRVGTEFKVNTNTTNDQQYPSIAALRNGNFVAMWDSKLQDGSGAGVYGQVFNANASRIGGEFQVNTNTANDQLYSSIAALSNGNFVAVWFSYGQDGPNYGVYGQIFNANSSKIGNEFQVNTHTTNDQLYPNIAALSNGNFAVVWQSYEQDGSGAGVYGQVFNVNSSKIGSELQVNTYTPGWQNYPSIAMLSEENFAVVWHSAGQDGSLHGVYGQMFNMTGDKIGNEFQANTYTALEQYLPAVVGLKNNNFVVVWESNGQDSDNWGIYGQVFNTNGQKIGSEFLVNTYTVNGQAAPRVSLLTNNNFVVVWQSYGQDGSEHGIYGQLFYGQLVAANYVNRTLTYTEDALLPISGLSILGALNEYAINTTLTVIPANAGSLTTTAFGKVSATYLPATGRWQAFGHRTDMNQVLAQLAFTPAKDTNQNVTISVEFNDGASSPVTGEIDLTAIPINDPPVIVNNQLTVTKGQAVILTAADLSAQDVDTSDSNLMFTVNNIAGGRFEFISDPGVAVTSFTQQQVNDSQVRFVPDGSGVKPAYKVTVSDGLLSSATTAATVNFILPNKPPIVLNSLPNKEVTVGESFSFTIPDTTFSDPEGMPLTYSAQQKDGNALPSWLQFNTVNRFFSGAPVQAGVNTLSVFATDAGNLTTQADFNLTALASPPKEPDVSTGAVIGGVVGGLVGLAALGGAAYAFWQKGFCRRKVDDPNAGHFPLTNRHSMARDGQAVKASLKG